MKIDMDKVLKRFDSKSKIFKNKDALDKKFTPENIPHREEEIMKAIHSLGHVIRGDVPKNIILSGRPGTGKTLVIRKVINEVMKHTAQKGITWKPIYVNCGAQKVADTEWRILHYIIKDCLGYREIQSSGISKNELYQKFFELISPYKIVTIILDEVDVVTKQQGIDGMFYTFTREETKKTDISLVGITNKVNALDSLDPRLVHAVCEEEIPFPIYNANQLNDILTDRSRIAFNPGVLDSGVIPKVCALGTLEHGDARKTLQLLRMAGEMADISGCRRVTEDHVDRSEEKITHDSIIAGVKNQPPHAKILLFSLIHMEENGNRNIQTGDLYSKYESIAKEVFYTPLSQQRLSEYIGELGDSGLIVARKVSHGRYGQTRMLGLRWSDSLRNKVKEILNQEIYGG